jgi:preprotein translocase subunit SecE
MEEGEVAESKRRGADAADEHLDEVFPDAVDDTSSDTDTSSDDEVDFVDDEQPTTRRRGAVVKTTVDKSGKTKVVATSPGLFERIARFIREVVAELRKVNWPSRTELLTYTSVVVIFVVVMMSIVGGLDWAFAWLVTHVFG